MLPPTTAVTLPSVPVSRSISMSVMRGAVGFGDMSEYMCPVSGAQWLIHHLSTDGARGSCSGQVMVGQPGATHAAVAAMRRVVVDPQRYLVVHVLVCYMPPPRPATIPSLH